MKLIVLAAGYATRLYPLTLDWAKPLLEVVGKPIIERALEMVEPIAGIDHIYVVTSAKFASQFHRWAEGYGEAQTGCDMTVINDGSTDDSNKLGAIGDLHLVLTSEDIADDIIVVAGDNLFSRNLEEFGEFCRIGRAPVLAVYDVGSLAEIKKYNSIETDADGRITFFEEKPANPRSTLTGIALYYYPKSTLPLIRQYVGNGEQRNRKPV